MEKKTASALANHFHTDRFFRYVLNYDYCFRTFAKQRWLNRKLIEVFIKEFKAFSEAYYRRALASSRILVNGEKVDENYVIR